MATQHLEVIPLGGLGEFGMNLMVYRHAGECIVVDAGMMFPGEAHLGVDVVVPDLAFLDGCGTIHGVVLTHGHEDHIGAVPYVLARHDVPILAPPHARGLVESRLAEHPSIDAPRLVTLPADGTPTRLGPFVIEPIRAAHSIPQSKMLALRTPVGTVLHTADFKIDAAPPGGESTDLAHLERLGDEGVLALFSDSTNADQPGTSPSESVVVGALDAILATAKARVFVTCFASNVERLAQLARLAVRHGRRITFVGSALRNQVEVAERLGLIAFPPGVRVTADEVMALPREQALVVATGSQGEPASALARIAVGKHRFVQLDDGDLVVHSAREIPGNEKSIGRMLDHVARRGADVITTRDAPVHASGHASRDDLRRVIELVRPRFLVPIHGEFRHLRAHARLGVECGLGVDSVRLIESGDVVALSADSLEVVDRVPVGQVFIDAALDEVDETLIEDRRRSAGQGILVAVVAVDRGGDRSRDQAEIVSRGFVPDALGEEGFRVDAERRVLAALAEATAEERRDEAMLKARIHTELKRFVRRRTQRKPLIIPVLVEL